MGDVGEAFNEMRELVKEKRQGHLDKAEKNSWPVRWTVHTPYHWSCVVNGKRLDYWPSRDKFQYEGRIIQGGIRGFINKRTSAGGVNDDVQ